METYKFETTVLGDGTIKIPELKKFRNKEIELFLIVKNSTKKTEKLDSQTIEDFLDKWTGFAKGINPNEEKFNYLMEKYK